MKSLTTPMAANTISPVYDRNTAITDQSITSSILIHDSIDLIQYDVEGGVLWPDYAVNVVFKRYTELLIEGALVHSSYPILRVMVSADIHLFTIHVIYLLIVPYQFTVVVPPGVLAIHRSEFFSSFRHCQSSSALNNSSGLPRHTTATCV